MDLSVSNARNNILGKFKGIVSDMIGQILKRLFGGPPVSLNVKMVIDQSLDYFHTSDNTFVKGLIIVLGLIFIWLFCMMTFLPIVQKRRKQLTFLMPLHKL